jgi:hypothetical protein
VPAEYELELVGARVGPLANPWEDDIYSEGGKTLPFFVERWWAGPAGNYVEEWSIRKGAEIYHRGPQQYVHIKGLQAAAKVIDRVKMPADLPPGGYQVVFVVEDRFMGSVDIKVTPARQSAA